MLRLGLIGLGFGANFVDTIVNMDSVRVSAICRREKTIPEKLPPGCVFFSNWEQFLSESDNLCDGVIIATPPHLHLFMAKNLMRKGLPVLIEKPVVESKSDFDKLSRESEKNKTPFMVDYTHLYAPAYVTLKELVKSKNSPVIALQSWGMNRGPVRVYSSLFDYGPHDIAMSLDFMGEVPKITDVRRTKTVDGEIFDLTMRFSNDVVGVARVGNGYHEKRRRFQVFTESGTFEYDDTKADKLTFDGEKIEIANTMPLVNVVNTFAKVVRREISSPQEPNLSYWTTVLLEEAFALSSSL